MVTSSPTRTPPVSSAVFHLNPKSFLLMTVLAEAAIRTLPHGSLVAREMLSTSSPTLRFGTIQLPVAANGAEYATDVGDHHVTDLEMNGGVGRINRPCRNRGKWIDGGRHKAPTAKSLARFNIKEGRIVGFVGRNGKDR
jgi:hypothetical protein